MSTFKKAIYFTAFVLAYAFVFAGCIYFWDAVFAHTYLASPMADLVVVLPIVIMFSVFMFYRSRTRERWLSEEAEKFMAIRSPKKAMPLLAWRKNLQRAFLWIPCLLVLVVSLFLPETAGIVTHLFRSPATVLGKYRIQTPLTCIIGTDRSTYLWTFSAPGIGRIGVRPYWSNSVPVSEMTFYPVPHPEEQLDRNVPLESAIVLAKQSFPFGKQTLTCWDLIYSNKFVGPSPTDRSIADIRCSTESDDFYAHFYGWRGDSATFYGTLQKIAIAE